MAEGWRVLVHGGVALTTDPGPAAAFLRASTPGAYTTTRTLDGASSLLLWDRHMARLSESLGLLHEASPHLYPHLREGIDFKRLVEPSIAESLAKSIELRRSEEEINLTVLLCGSEREQSQDSSGCEVFVHASNYRAVNRDEILPGARVAVMGPGRELARAKYSLWASTRQVLENVKPSNTNEIILSNDGDALLEGTLTNFFVVKVRDSKTSNEENHQKAAESDDQSRFQLTDYEVLTAPLSDGVLPGVMRNLVIEVCREAGIRVRESSPSWSSHLTWREAFLTNGLRILQPVTSIQMPASWTQGLDPKLFKETEWQSFTFEKLVMDRVCQLSTPLKTFTHR
ncbi:hypothetical protein Mapa_003531 [Marchantia paleacea]|nr:hypothetical protein Mapa_003531 [Marchantia paleacea]